MNAQDLKKHYAMEVSDLPDPSGVNVFIIRGVDSEYFEVISNGKKEEQVRHLLILQGVSLPLRLNNTRVDVLVSLHGEETDHWIGKKIGLYAGPVSAYGKTKIDILMALHSVEHLQTCVQPRTFRIGAATAPAALPASTASAAMDMRPIGGRNAVNFNSALAEQGASEAEYLAWLEKQNEAAFLASVNTGTPEWPRGAAPLMQRFLAEYGQAKQLPAPPPPPPPPPPAPVRPAARAPFPASEEPLDHSDIPF